MNEVNALLEESSALVYKSTLYEMYQKTVNFAPYSFFDINTNAKDVSNMFFISFWKSGIVNNIRQKNY